MFEPGEIEALAVAAFQMMVWVAVQVVLILAPRVRWLSPIVYRLLLRFLSTRVGLFAAAVLVLLWLLH